MLEEILIRVVSQFPYLSTLIASVGVLRLLVPVLMNAARIITKQTPTTSDDKALDEIEKSGNYKKFLSILEWLTSVKVPR